MDMIARDAKKSGGLEKVTIDVDEINALQFRECAKELMDESRNQRSESGLLTKEIEDFPIPVQAVSGTLAVCGALAGLVLGYALGSNGSTVAAEYLNNSSYLLAPIAGVTQLVGSFGGAIVGGVVGACAGAISSCPFTVPYMRTKFPLAGKSDNYEKINIILSRDDEKKVGK